MNMVSRALARRQKGEKGFTLVELLVVVIIIGILAAVSVPIYLNQRKSAWNSNAEQDVKNAQVQVETAMTANNGKLPFTGTITCYNANGTSAALAASSAATSDAQITCSPDVHLTVTAGTDRLTYTISGYHQNGSKTYNYDSSTNSSVQVSDGKPTAATAGGTN